MDNNPRDRRTSGPRRRWVIIAITYLIIGLIWSISQLFSADGGDLPRWDDFARMVHELPASFPDLLLVTIFWIVMPAITWPLGLLFALFVSASNPT